VTSQTVARGGHQALTARVTANVDAGTVLVDFEVYNRPNGKKAFQDAQNVELRAQRPVTVRRDFRLPANAATGLYTFEIGVFGIGWSHMYAWDNDAGRFSVT
jgi:hypothetical protein